MSVFALTLLALLPQARGPLTAPLVADRPVPRVDHFLVEFRERSYDLDSLRRAIWSGKSASDVADVIADLEQRTAAERVAFTREVQALGGRVLQNWWLINASLVQIDAKLASEIAKLPQVRRVLRDEAVPQAGTEDTDPYNHATQLLHAKGLTGLNRTAPVSVAVMDSGVDSDMANTGRPHRMFFPGGDINNKTGGGIGGSRLLVNEKVGALVADDQHGHGTAVASVAAGAKWGPPASGNGHAYGARIASYSIADYLQNGNVWSYYSTMISAWQRITADKVKHNIVAANNSFSGNPSATHALQQALDAAARTGDILITVAAGNAGPNVSTGQQSAANGIAVAAIYPNEHWVLRWSSRGPVLGDTQRTYPDLSAVTFSLTGARDCEARVDAFGGTSNSAPQVAGVATVLRAAFPKMRADETKALLLASASDPTDDGKIDRNTLGVGMLHAGNAMQASTPVRGTLTTTSPGFRHPMPVIQGESYGVAAVWHRTTYNSMQWSNLDLFVLDGTTVIASSTTPRNLYEKLDFVAKRSGVYTLEVRGVTLDGGTQDFALANSPNGTSSKSQRRGTFWNYADGCRGTGLTDGVLCMTSNPSMGPNDLTNYRAGNWDMALSLTASRDISVTGFEMLLWPDEAVATPLRLYKADNTGRPTGSVLATATLDVPLTEGRFGARFSSAQTFRQGERFCIVFDAETVRVWLVANNTSWTPTQYYGQFPCQKGWPFGGQARFSYRVLCGSPVPGAEPLISNVGYPTIGASYDVRLTESRPNSVAVLVTGLSNKTWGTIPLPLKLGTTDCALAASLDISGAFAIDAQGRGKISFTLPSDPALRYANYYQQCIVLDATANVTGLVLTNAKRARIGN